MTPTRSQIDAMRALPAAIKAANCAADESWRAPAVEWLRKRAADQACTNAAYPRHAQAYRNWREIVKQYERAATEIERGE